MFGSLSERASVERVENVVLFVSDAMRYDFLPQSVRRLGVTAKGIAPSTFTASSLPSLTSGQYPATHRVWMFDDQLAETPPLLDGSATDVGFDAEAVWPELPAPEKPPLQIHHLTEERTLDDLEPPFTHVVHDVGPHAPYGFDNGVFESTKAFFEEHERRRAPLVSLYREDCRRSASRFLDIYDDLEERGLLSETLVIFTSDHGQCLGEPANGGRFGHGHPMVPETVEIPVVFAGAGLPRGREYGALVSGTDIAPTAHSAQRGRVSDLVDGLDLWTETPPEDRTPRSDVWQHLDVGVGPLDYELTVYAATSAWSEDGGHIFQRGSSAERTVALGYDNCFRGYSPAWRHNSSPGSLLSFLALSLQRELTFGAPDFTREAAREEVPSAFQTGDPAVTDTTLSDRQEDRLRDLGYLK
ncbi:sulfatase-like hydrolase/transferase [Haloarcula amylovorans]|uniref:sulfatase-like hydrolase/transferase n=1 Tax=Haloarcula amylovorans TaxID=2562280 RepID=UPI00107627D6|nr:sulfatase-like hydrolase/transferase [Halomicroarcula amylolytica]